MILFFYNLALIVALVLTSPWWLWKMATAEKYRDVYKRFGRVPQSVLQTTAGRMIFGKYDDRQRAPAPEAVVNQ